MLKKHTVIGIVALAVILGNGEGGWCSAATEHLQTVIQDFCHTNIPVSHAICLLSKQSPVPIDAVIEDTNDPPVTICEEKATIGEILQKLLTQHPGHHPHGQSGAVLVLPDWLLDKQVFPLTQKVTKFNITCYSHNSISEAGRTVYFYRFDDPENPVLNISLGALGASRKPDYSNFPHVRTFENRSIVEILTGISSEQKQSFFCYRLNNNFVRAQNKEWAEKKMLTWWPNPDAPCYSIFWGTAWTGVRGQE